MYRHIVIYRYIDILICDVKTTKYRWRIARHFNSKYCDRRNPSIFLHVQLIEYVQSDVNLGR